MTVTVVNPNGKRTNVYPWLNCIFVRSFFSESRTNAPGQINTVVVPSGAGGPVTVTVVNPNGKFKMHSQIAHVMKTTTSMQLLIRCCFYVVMIYLSVHYFELGIKQSYYYFIIKGNGYP